MSQGLWCARACLHKRCTPTPPSVRYHSSPSLSLSARMAPSRRREPPQGARDVQGLLLPIFSLSLSLSLSLSAGFFRLHWVGRSALQDTRTPAILGGTLCGLTLGGTRWRVLQDTLWDTLWGHSRIDSLEMEDTGQDGRGEWLT